MLTYVIFNKKCVFHRPELIGTLWDSMGLKFQVLEMEKWNISMDRAQRVDKKNGSFD